jgi:hypothetical protein
LGNRIVQFFQMLDCFGFGRVRPGGVITIEGSNVFCRRPGFCRTVHGRPFCGPVKFAFLPSRLDRPAKSGPKAQGGQPASRASQPAKLEPASQPAKLAGSAGATSRASQPSQLSQQNYRIEGRIYPMGEGSRSLSLNLKVSQFSLHLYGSTGRANICIFTARYRRERHPYA